MKKVNTAAANLSEQKLTIGLELGDRSSWYCVLDERGEVLLEQKLGTTPKAMKEIFEGIPRSRMGWKPGRTRPG
jgi:transposase